MSIIEAIKHPIKTFNRNILKNLIKDALEHLPELKEIGLNYLKAHKDEFLAAIKEAITKAVKSFIDKKLKKDKDTIVDVTGNPN